MAMTTRAGERGMWTLLIRMDGREHEDEHYDVKASVRDRVNGPFIAQVVNKGKAAPRVVL